MCCLNADKTNTRKYKITQNWPSTTQQQVAMVSLMPLAAAGREDEDNLASFGS